MARQTRMTDEKRRRIEKVLLEDRFIIYQVLALRFGISERTVSDIAKRLGVPRKKGDDSIKDAERKALRVPGAKTNWRTRYAKRASNNDLESQQET